MSVAQSNNKVLLNKVKWLKYDLTQLQNEIGEQEQSIKELQQKLNKYSKAFTANVIASDTNHANRAMTLSPAQKWGEQSLSIKSLRLLHSEKTTIEDYLVIELNTGFKCEDSTGEHVYTSLRFLITPGSEESPVITEYKSLGIYQLKGLTVFSSTDAANGLLLKLVNSSSDGVSTYDFGVLEKNTLLNIDAVSTATAELKATIQGPFTAVVQP